MVHTTQNPEPIGFAIHKFDAQATTWKFKSLKKPFLERATGQRCPLLLCLHYSMELKKMSENKITLSILILSLSSELTNYRLFYHCLTLKLLLTRLSRVIR